ncbi:MAG: hypothetical protein PHH31_08135 [Acidaminococcaceae bacterium]|nr:hypothetical protein [Acidaminococcaceae bacterium]MDD4722932.1 hypothetical protein [Acidaminococcaceae bacterium]
MAAAAARIYAQQKQLTMLVTMESKKLFSVVVREISKLTHKIGVNMKNLKNFCFCRWSGS